MWLAFANRRLLLDLIGTKNPDEVLQFRSENQISDIANSEKEMTLLWRDKPSRRDFLPEIILVNQKDMRDFLAWTSTYLSAIRPLTAYCRVLEREQAKHVLYKKQKPSLGNRGDAFVGVVISEAFSHYYNNDLKRITPISLKSTYSFAMARACAMELEKDLLEDDVPRRWDKVRELSQQPKRILTKKAIEKVWQVLRFLNKPLSLDTTSSSPLIVEACIDISQKGVIDDAKWKHFARNLPGLRDSINVMRESKEQRVEWFEDVALMLKGYSAIDIDTASFLCAYLLSQITRGSMQHTEILRPYLERFPTAIIWYGLCASLYENTGIYNELGGLGSRILRDLQEEFNISERPKADIAFEELEVLFSSEKIDKKFIQENHSYLTVELLPGLHTVVIWPPYEDNGTEKDETQKEIEKSKQWPVREPPLFANEKEYTCKNELLTTLGESLRKAQYLYDKLCTEYNQPLELQSKKYHRKDSLRKRRRKT